MKRVNILLILVFASICLSCAKAPSIYQDSEDMLKTAGNLRKFHAIVHFPKEIKLNYPGYIVGVEKSPQDKVAKMGIKLLTKDKGGIKRIVKRVQKSHKVLYISHIYSYNRGVKPLYNLYTTDKKYIKNAFNNSYIALDRLKKDITKNRAKYNIVLVFVMGWNTSQEEALRNFNSLYRNIKEQSSKDFKPLFIGVTWPSEWESSLAPDGAIKLSSFPGKAADADELGITWLGALLHNTLKDIKLPIVVVGHSFGARALSVATFKGNSVYKKSPLKLNKIDKYIALQGAFSMNRFLHKGIEKIYFNTDQTKTKVIFTSSKYDSANKMPIVWNTPYVGSSISYKRHCKSKYSNKFTCIKYKKNDITKYLKSIDKLLYLDCSSIVKNNIYNSGGGAHSDIYDKEMGYLLWQIIKSSY
jgi:hypothetical protein